MVTKKQTSEDKSRRRILEFLKTHGAQDAQVIAGEIGTSAMAVRQHLYGLQKEHLVTFQEESRPIGRPAKLWHLTQEANEFFPDAHAALAQELIASLTKTFGASGLDKLIAQRTEEQITHYQSRLPKRASLQFKLEKLAAIRCEEGYMAEVLKAKDGTPMLVENHCPICSAASVCSGLCQAELDVFQKVLGEKIHIEREEHILSGARRCAYRVTKKVTKSKSGKILS
ncbi:transcriptional regulator [bacterium]|nr:transcriptional regulator [bacterium]